LRSDPDIRAAHQSETFSTLGSAAKAGDETRRIALRQAGQSAVPQLLLKKLQEIANMMSANDPKRT